MEQPLLIVAALKDEVKPLLAQMSVDCTVHLKPSILYKGKIFDREVSLLVTGMGAERMRRGLEGALALHSPSSILLVGYAGGTSPVLKAGSLVLAEGVVDTDTGDAFQSDTELLEKAKTVCKEKEFSFQTGKMVMVSRVISSPHEKADIGVTHAAMALDMESAAFAKTADEKKIPFLIVKAILDPVEERLLPLEDCVEATGEPKPLKLAEHLLKNPKEMMQLPRLQFLVSQAREATTQFLESWLSMVRL